MSAPHSPQQTLRDHLIDVLASDHKFEACTKSLDIHHYVFFELSLTPISIFNVFESLFDEYQPSSSATSYYIDYHNRYKLFMLLSHIMSNCNTYSHSKHGKHHINNTQLGQINAECHKLRNIVIHKLHSLIFTKVFPAKSAVQSQCDEVKKRIETWFNQNIFEMKTFMLQNIVKDLSNTSNLYILNETEYEEPPNLDSLLKETQTHSQQKQKQQQQQQQQTPSYIELPPTFNQNRRYNNEYNNNYGRNAIRGRSRRGYGNGNNNDNIGNYHNNNNNNNNYRGGYRGNNKNNYRSQRPNNNRYYNETHNEYNQYDGIKHRSISRSRSRSRGREKDQEKEKEKEEEEMKIVKKEREKVKEKKKEKKKDKKSKYRQSVIHGVNSYPDIREFRDEDKMWRFECEIKRKEQRKQRVLMSLKMQNECLNDEFEKFFNEGIKRWDLVNQSCLDKRIWEWQINLYYNDSKKHYGYGNSNIRHSPYCKKKKQ